LRRGLLPRILESFERLAGEADLVLVEGAGSPAEINLRDGDIANMGFALAAGLPVLLVGDIERGGVIASLVGTVALLEPAERALLKGFIVNKFRGDPSLFADGMRIIAERTGLEPLGLLPFWPQATRLPAEDAVGLGRRGGGEGRIKIAVPMIGRIANFDDLDPLRAEPEVTLVIVPPGKPLPGDADLVILPGSKATIADLAMLRAEGWDVDLAAHRRRGSAILGLCGGYQMLGRRIADPNGIEGPPGAVEGLGLLDVETELGGEKRLVAVSARDAITGAALEGYEMHIGRTDGPGRQRPMLMLGDRPEGAVSADGLVMGCYLHGLFAADGFRRAFLGRFGADGGGTGFEAEVEAALDGLADHLEAHLDLDRLLEIANAR
jgi:adenosylcobyric acid synthase